jgi:peptide/nickel transport system ATP-binding protein/oligopeptide transport system ATP-binding protein
MYAGKVAERASVNAIFKDPQHPYTIGLMGSMPRMDEDVDRLVAISGVVPPPFRLPSGCRFNPRCPFSDEECTVSLPALHELQSNHLVACHKAPVEDFV